MVNKVLCEYLSTTVRLTWCRLTQLGRNAARQSLEARQYPVLSRVPDSGQHLYRPINAVGEVETNRQRRGVTQRHAGRCDDDDATC